MRQPYTHQVEAAEHAHAGRSVVVSTGTASGKSLAYLLPTLTAVREGARAGDGRGATVLYLSPTKALAADQLRALEELAVPDVRAATVDGDTPTEERDWARAHASYVLTNPDMLHHSLLPGHARWAPFWRSLRFVVVDECHAYRGVFGSHVAAVLRRLRRVAARYGSDPVFVLASATVSEPALSAGRLVGGPVRAVTDDGSPRGSTAFALWEPPLTELIGERGAPVRRSVHAETADLLADLVVDGARTLAFIRSRRGAEVVVADDQGAGGRGRPVAARTGSRPTARATCRRSAGRSRRTCSPVGCSASPPRRPWSSASTSRDSTRCCSPGGRARCPRCGSRPGGPGAPVRARSRCSSPGTTPSTPTWCTTPRRSSGGPSRRPCSTRPTPTCWRRTCAPRLRSCRSPRTTSRSSALGRWPWSTTSSTRQLLRARPGGWYWTRPERASDLADLRGTGGGPVRVVETATGRVVGTVDRGAADRSVHAGAVYVHQGGDLPRRLPRPRRQRRPRDPGDPRLDDLGARGDRPPGPRRTRSACLGRGQPVPRRRRGDEPGRRLPASSAGQRRGARRGTARPPGQDAAHGVGVVDRVRAAARAAARSARPTYPGRCTRPSTPPSACCPWWRPATAGTSAGCRRPSTRTPDRPASSSSTATPEAPASPSAASSGPREWLTATLGALRACECPAGCPSCVQSPKCGNGNEPLDKSGAVRLLSVLLAGRPEPAP